MATRQLRFYFPARTLILIFGEVGILVASFLLATVLQFREQTYAVLSYEYGLYKIAAVVAMGLLCMYYLDFYDTQRIPGRGELQFRVLVVVGTLSLLLGLLGAIFPRFMVGNYVFLTGLPILTFLLIAWRNVFFAMNGSERFMQRTLFLGDGDYSNSFWDEVKSRSALGLKLIGYVSPDSDPAGSAPQANPFPCVTSLAEAVTTPVGGGPSPSTCSGTFRRARPAHPKLPPWPPAMAFGSAPSIPTFSRIRFTSTDR